MFNHTGTVTFDDQTCTMNIIHMAIQSKTTPVLRQELTVVICGKGFSHQNLQ